MSQQRVKRQRVSQAPFDPSAGAVEQNVTKYVGLSAQLLFNVQKHCLRHYAASKRLKVVSTSANALSSWAAALPTLCDTPGAFPRTLADVDPAITHLNKEMLRVFPVLTPHIVTGGEGSNVTGAMLTKLRVGELKSLGDGSLALFHVEITLNSWWWENGRVSLRT
eukprot:TRINITY_DN51743_c0_g1_i1.p1 TRINITY_DN51743_c0_g1~~TRINITY_DN51743_c0_g1_i1.p1  ORF type:complete len:165 (-),score=19.53 TRINITY_DN51743_c0_g1_i1:446-940(-)